VIIGTNNISLDKIEVQLLSSGSIWLEVLCYKMKVWIDFRVRVRTDKIFIDSYIISLQQEREKVCD